MDTPLVKRAYNLGLKAVPNFLGLTEEQIAYYERHLDELSSAIRRGFIIPRQEASFTEQAVQPVVKTVTPTLFKTSETDLHWWIDQTQLFTQKCLGIRVDLRKQFAIPAELPWKSVIPVFDPGNLTSRQVLNILSVYFNLGIYEDLDVMKYSGSEMSGVPMLHFIENSVRPNEDTLTNPGTSPNRLRKTGKSYLRLRGYSLAFALYYFARKDYLDKQKFTWFPEDRLPNDYVARGGCSSINHMRFFWGGAGRKDHGSGARVAISVPLRT